MKRDEIFWQEIVSEIDKELVNIEKLKQELKEVLEKSAPFSERIKGSIFHDFYNSCERIFRRVATSINGGFEEQQKWHKELLYRMTIPIKEIRPRLISEELAAELDDYLSFRHIFRNIYGFELKGERLERLTKKFEKVCEKFKKEIKTFLIKMK